jgi:hypothetical protein
LTRSFVKFTSDITRSLQHKQDLLAKARKQHALLTNLNALNASELGSNPDDRIDTLAEPFPTLPLWRRVDRDFWWNEWLLKPFIDAGVSVPPSKPFLFIDAILEVTFVHFACHARILSNIILSHLPGACPLRGG